MSTTGTIEIENIGPIKKVSIPLTPGGGILTLKAMNDMGKSLGVDAISRSLGGKQKVTRRDGVTSSGTVKGFGITLKVGASSRTTGELEVESIEGKYSIDDLIAPPIKSPAAADGVRIKTLLKLTEAEPDLTPFAELLGGMEALLALSPEDDLRADDLVEMCRKVKAAIEAGSRKSADLAKSAADRAFAMRQAADEIDTSVEIDVDILQDRITEVVREEARLDEQRDARGEAVLAATKAQEAYDKALNETPEAFFEDVTKSVKGLARALKRSETIHSEATDALALAQMKFDAAKRERETITGNLALAQQKLATVKAYDDAQGARLAAVKQFDDLPDPTDEETEAASRAVTEARKASEAGALARKALKDMEAARDLEAKSKTHGDYADSLREVAKNCDTVLADAINSPGLRVIDGRLVTDVEGRGKVFFSDRSFGTRCALAFRAILAHVGDPDRPTIIALSQERWESLDWKNREEMNAACKRQNVWIVTAESDKEPFDGDGGVRAEVFGDA